jgi:hypothetical protein
MNVRVKPAIELLDARREAALAFTPMDDLDIIAATSTARHWWPGASLAARWRD